MFEVSPAPMRGVGGPSLVDPTLQPSQRPNHDGGCSTGTPGRRPEAWSNPCGRKLRPRDRSRHRDAAVGAEARRS